MKKLLITGTLCALVAVAPNFAAAEETTTTTTVTTSSSEMLTKIQDLMKLIADLQAKLATARGEIKELVKDLAVGAEGDDVKEIQEILASDPGLFKVKPTGYYGPLTEEAIKKFQERYGLEVTGVVDEATREVMKELKMEKKNGMIPPGLVKSDEVKNRIKQRLQDKWGDCIWGEKFRASDCVKGDDDGDDSDDSDDDSDDDSAGDSTREEAVAAIEDAAEAITTLKADLKTLIDEDADADTIDDARDALRKAQKKLLEARRKLARGQYDEAVNKAEDSLEESTGVDAEDSSDDSDDSDDDSDEDEDEDDSDDDDSSNGDDDDDDDEDDDDSN